MMISSTTESTYEYPEEFICPISFDLMTQPLVSIYGHHYQKAAILGWLSEGHRTCPLTRKPLTLRMLVSDSRLQSMIKGWMLQNGLTVQHYNEHEDPDRVVGLGCILAPGKEQLRHSIMRQTGFESRRRPFRFLFRRQKRTTSASVFA